ncbi:MAG: hypothetical protein L3J15_00595 [Devosiaceae bacterium]|nr:hypothetical protein [Devosiaceae bacterium]
MTNIRFENALKRIDQKTPPIWFMRQAGRYHQHYQALSKEHGFTKLCQTPDLAAEVAMGPIDDFDFDVSILFSDILFILNAMGMGLEYTSTGPKLAWQLNKDTISKLDKSLDVAQKLSFQAQAVRKTRARLPDDKSLIGFNGGLWSLFTYAVEGTHKGNLIETKKSMSLFHSFMEILLPLYIQNTKEQLEAGAEIIMMFDTAAGELSPALYQSLVLPYIEEIANHFPKKIGLYTKGTTPSHYNHPFFEKDILAGLGVDHRWSASDMRNLKIGFSQGNFDQSLLFLPQEEFLIHLNAYLDRMYSNGGPPKGWVSGLGHGILPKTPEKNVALFVKTVREYNYEK